MTISKDKDSKQHVAVFDRLLRIEEVASLLGIAKSTVYKNMRLGLFPKPINLTERTSVWRLSTEEDWVRSKEQSPSS